EPARGDPRLQRLHAETDGQVRLDGAGLEQTPRPEAADVPVHHCARVIELDDRARICIRADGLQEKGTGHPQVAEERAPRLEVDDQILAATTDPIDALTFELGRDRQRIVRCDAAAIDALGAVDGPAGQGRFELGADRLDLGQLWHRSSLVSAAIREEAGRLFESYEISSWTIGVLRGSSSPIEYASSTSPAAVSA